MSNIGNAVALNEKIRTYWFPTKNSTLVSVTLNDVVELVVRDSGSHRVKTADGKLHIIPSGWVHIEIDDPAKQDWTV